MFEFKKETNRTTKDRNKQNSEDHSVTISLSNRVVALYPGESAIPALAVLASILVMNAEGNPVLKEKLVVIIMDDKVVNKSIIKHLPAMLRMTKELGV